MINVVTHHKQIVPHINYPSKIAFFQVHGITKQAMDESVRVKLMTSTGVSRIDETFYVDKMDKSLVIRHKGCKEQTKREVNRILVGMTLKNIHPA